MNITSTLKVYDNNNLVNTITYEKDNSLFHLCSILMGEKLKKINSKLSYYYDKQGHIIVNIELKITEKLTYKYEFKGLDYII